MNPARKEELDGKWKKVATAAVTDEQFKTKLTADPVAVMGEYDIRLPEGVQVKIGTGNEVNLVAPADATDAVKEEVQWWRWRLNIISVFGEEEQERSVKYVAPDNSDEDV